MALILVDDYVSWAVNMRCMHASNRAFGEPMTCDQIQNIPLDQNVAESCVSSFLAKWHLDILHPAHNFGCEIN